MAKMDGAFLHVVYHPAGSWVDFLHMVFEGFPALRLDKFQCRAISNLSLNHVYYYYTGKYKSYHQVKIGRMEKYTTFWWVVQWRICDLFKNVFQPSWRRKEQPTPVFLPGKSHGWRNLVGYSLWEQSQTRLSDFTFTFHFRHTWGLQNYWCVLAYITLDFHTFFFLKEGKCFQMHLKMKTVATS